MFGFGKKVKPFSAEALASEMGLESGDTREDLIKSINELHIKKILLAASPHLGYKDVKEAAEMLKGGNFSGLSDFLRQKVRNFDKISAEAGTKTREDLLGTVAMLEQD